MTAKFEVRIEALPEDTFVGDAFTETDADTRSMIADILERSLEGEVWAWCCVRVTVSCGGLSESDCLGCCSYDSEEDFRKNSGYFDDMVSGCKRALVRGARAVLQAAEAEGFADDGAL